MIMHEQRLSDEKTMKGVAIIGAGYWGRNLVRNYADLGVLKIICDQNENILKLLGKQYPDVETCFSVNDVLGRPDVTGVVIATPVETHYSIARESLLAGKDTFVEKPLALKITEGRDLVTLAQKQGRCLMVGHLMCYHPAFVKLQEMVKGGDLGRINYIYSHRLNLGKIRREENILWSFAPHDISMILSLTGEEPESVFAIGGNYLHNKIADVTVTHMNFASGIKSHIFVSWLHPFKEQKLVVVGDRQMAVFDDTKPWKEKLSLYPHEIIWENGVPFPVKAKPELVSVEEKEPLRIECEHFLACMDKHASPLTDGWEGLRVLKILDTAQRSLNEKSRRIEISNNNDYKYDHAVFVHSSAVIDDNVSIGKGTKIWHFSHILHGSTIGENCNIGQNVVIGPNVNIGNGCRIQNNVSIYEGVDFEEDVFCGPSVVFTNVFNPRAHIRRMSEIRLTKIKKGATLGANCTIVCGNTVGRYAFIGAGATVTRNVPDHALMVGNPARQVAWICECGNKLDTSLSCTECKKKYLRVEHGLTEHT